MRHVEVKCPKCNATLNSHTIVSDNENTPPVTGDIIVCLYCAAALKVDADGAAHELTESEEIELNDKEREELSKAQFICKVAIEMKKHLGDKNENTR